MRRQFLTTKVVEVEEMTREEYVKSRGWELPENEKELADEKVFKVIYSDGYVSMCPKERFLEQAYEIKNNSITPELVKSFVKNTEVTTERIYGKLNTVLKYELVNGFTGVEATSCVDEKNYSEEIGKEILLNRLYDKIWFGLGFALGMANKNEEVQENER